MASPRHLMNVLRRNDGLSTYTNLQEFLDSKWGILAVDNEGKIIAINQALARMSGIPNDKAMGRYLGEWPFFSNIAEVFKRGESRFFRYVSDSLKMSVLTFPLMTGFKIDGWIGLFGSIIHEQHNLQEVQEAWELKTQLSILMDYSHDGILITDEKGNLINCNRTYEKIVGLSIEQFSGSGSQELSRRDYIPIFIIRRAVQIKHEVTELVTFPTGRETIITCVPVYATSGNISKVVCNVRDMTELEAIKRDLKESRRLTENYRLELAHLLSPQECFYLKGIVSTSKEMAQVVETSLKAAQVECGVLIIGETGVGKDLVARMIHNNSPRAAKGMLVKIDCASIPEQLLEAELFGYERGSFTDARREGKVGRLELAHHGTLFLDEIGELPLSLQSKLLNVLQEKRIMRIGGLKEIDLDFRVIAATNRDLEQLVEQGLFRRDLYYRLNILPVYIPPLRERRDDIIALAGHFLRMFNSRYGVNKTFSDPVLKIFSAYEWPGNGRELANLIERLLVMSPHDLIIRDDLPLKLGCRTGKCDRDGHEMDADHARMKPNVSLRRALEDFELNLIRDALRENQTLRQAADDLEIDLSTLVRKKRKYRL